MLKIGENKALVKADIEDCKITIAMTPCPRYDIS
jgi:hypothetical protein